MEDNQVVAMKNIAEKSPNSDFKIIPNFMVIDPEETIEYCMVGAPNIPVKIDCDCDAFGDEEIEKVFTTLKPCSPSEPTYVLPKISHVTVLEGKVNVSLDSKKNSTNGTVISSRPIGRTSLSVRPILAKEKVSKQMCKEVLIRGNDSPTISVNDHDLPYENQVNLLPNSKAKVNDLDNSLVSDWRDNNSGSKKLESEGEIKETARSSKSAVIKVKIDSDRIQRRSRVIKKRIIWDPDEPETSYPYASLVQSKIETPKPKNVKTPDPSKPAAINVQIDNDRIERVSRVIKKKIIWDPDDPETSYPYASLVQRKIETPKSKNVKTPDPSKPAATNVQIDNDRIARKYRTIKKKLIWDPDEPKSSFSSASLVQNTSKKPKLAQRKDKESEEFNDLRKRKSNSTLSAKNTAKKTLTSEIDVIGSPKWNP